MNVVEIKEYLTNNPSEIIKLLELSNFFHIHYNSRRNEIRSAKDQDGNHTSVVVNCETLGAKCYSNGISGNIITLIQEHNDLSFIDTLQHIQTCLNIDIKTAYKKPNYIFGGVFKKVSNVNFELQEDKIYNDSILKEFANYPNLRFLKDNISIPSQIKFKVGYDPCSGRITVPWRNVNGQIIGIMGRYNGEIEDNKWLPIIPFKKSQVLYGFSENYLSIAKAGVVYIFESEKSVMQLDTYGIRCGIATGGSTISETQALYIKHLPVEKIVLCYDEGLEEHNIRLQANKLINTAFFEKEVSYIVDKNNIFITKGSKCSPSDLGKKTFLNIIQKCEVNLSEQSDSDIFNFQT